MPSDPLPLLRYPTPRRPTAAMDTFFIHGRFFTPPGRPDQPDPYFNVAGPGLLPRTYDQDSVMDDTAFLSPNGSVLQTPWDAGPSWIFPHTCYDWQEPHHQDRLYTAPITSRDVGSSSTVPHQHQDRLHTARIDDTSQPAASSSTLASQDEVAPPASQAGVQRPTKSSRARSTDGRFPCDVCGISLTRNSTLQRHRNMYCPGPGGRRGRKPSKGPRKFDGMN
jgi:hypothetical protein